MGYRCRWLAVRAGARAEILSGLRFAITEELNEEVYDTGLHTLDVPSWCVVIGAGWDFMDLVDEEHAQRLSAAHEVIFFYTDDTPMRAEVACFRNGTAVWSVRYDGSDGISKPVIEGDLPERARAALAAGRAQQKADAEADYIYDSVAEIGRELVGFRHDQTLSSGKYLPIFQLEPMDKAPSTTLASEAVLTAAKRVLPGRNLEAIVNEDGVVELFVVVTAVANPKGADEVALAKLRKQGLEADDGDELLFPVYYLPDDEGRAIDQQHSGIGELLKIPRDSFAAMQRELATGKPN